MFRDYRVFLEDILEATNKINTYIADMTFQELMQDPKTLDAVVRNLEIIGEATKNIPENVRNQHLKIEWKKIAGLRDILIHEYFGVDIHIIWDILKNKLPDLKSEVIKMLVDNN